MEIAREEMLDFVRNAGHRYWPSKKYPADRWFGNDCNIQPLGNEWVELTLPASFQDLGVNGKLLLDKGCMCNPNAAADDFSNYDLYLAAFSFLAGIAERKHEEKHGTIQSFSFALSLPETYFQKAWANRILLILRRMEARDQKVSEDTLFGAFPAPDIRLEHDVDALDKTIPIRIKQSVFEASNFVKYICRGQFRIAALSAKAGLRMMFTNTSYNHLDWVADQEIAKGVKATFYIHARQKYRSVKSWLFDPGYFCEDARLKEFVSNRKQQGFLFGLHPSFKSFNDKDLLEEERNRLEGSLDINVKMVRQHWLRFSWKHTWRAQQDAGLAQDATLGFNDRIGFRCAAALEYKPWGISTLLSAPLMIMDSHFYSYEKIGESQRRDKIKELINEVVMVGGVACINWHPHTLSSDYDWKNGYLDVLDAIAEAKGSYE